MSDTPKTDAAFAQLEETVNWVCEFAGMLNEARMLDDAKHAKEAMQKLEREHKDLISDYVALKKYALHLQKCLDNLETSK